MTQASHPIRVWISIGLAVLLMTLVSATAFANPDGGGEDDPVSFTSPGELEELTAGALPIVMPDEAPNPPAFGETEDLGRAEAEDLLQDVFGPAIKAPASVFEELEVEAFRSDHVAVVAGSAPEASPGLLSSSLPLRAENEEGQKELLDLGLESAGAHLEPENPLVEVEIPTQLSQGISLPESDLRIDLATGQTDRNASTPGDAVAFFPNVDIDTDFVVAAVPTGFETFTHLRSPDAPTEQTFEITIPAGHRLQGRPDGGAQLMGPGEEAVLSVSAPSAMDAEGDSVPAALRVDGEAVVVSVDPPADAVYPILVDPLFESYNFTTGQSGKEADWKEASNPGFATEWSIWAKWGMTIRSIPGATAPGNQGLYNYYVPRYWSDLSNPEIGEAPTSYIRHINLWNLYFTWGSGSKHPYPFLQMGLWSDNKQQFVSYGSRFGYEGPLNNPAHVYPLPNPDEVTDVKRGGFSLATFDSSNAERRDVMVGQASVEVSDGDSPGFGELGSVPEWVNDKVGSAIKYKVTDPGLGIHSLKLKYPAAVGGAGETTASLGCTGGASSFCPRTASQATKSLSYSPGLISQGEHWVQITAADPVNHATVGTSRIKVDHMAPGLALSGNLTEQGGVGTKLPQYTLNYSATDGDDAAAASGLPIGTAGTGTGQLQRPMGVAVDTSGNVFVVDRLNNRVVKYSPSGSYLAQFGSSGSGDGQFNDPRGIAISPSGTVWVTDVGNRRIQEFTAAGQFIRKATFSDSASQPYGITSGPGGVLWVADLGLSRVVKLSESTLANLATIGVYGNPKLVSPVGVATDASGNVWVADNGADKILQFDSSGQYKFTFGSTGSADGQLSAPVGIDVSPSGNIAVMDRNNNRVQIFETDGKLLRKFGTHGVGNAQFIEASGLSFGPNNSLFIADSGNQRVTRWSHADQDPQSGAATVEIQVDGALVHASSPGCVTKNCSISNSWSMNADHYTPGLHKVDVTATDAVGLSTTKTIQVETHGDRQPPAIALSGSMTEQASLGTTRPSYRLKAVATDPGTAEERRSGVQHMSIRIDGTTVDTVTPGCPAGGCSITREWTLNSDNYAPGSHVVEIRAMDAIGRVTTKSLTINIERDTTPPVFQSLGALYTAPSGWVEQKLYSYTANITDENGYGLTSVQLKIDGQVVKGQSGSCTEGGCGWLFGWFQKLDLSAYDGGAHPAELIATDGAGNWRKKSWTINVVPSDEISRSEAIATVEASDETSGANTIGEIEEGAEEELPMGSDVLLEGESTGFTAPEAATPLLIGHSPDEGMTVRIPSEDVTEESCPLVEQELVEEEPSEPVPPEERVEPCDVNTSYGEELIELEPVGITPVQTSQDATDLGVAADHTVAVSANVHDNVDQIVRPIYNGAQTFTAIRDVEAPTQYSWKVELEEDQTLSLIDPHHAIVLWDSGQTAFTITATAAHDAIGTEVPTSLSASGDTLTLHVPHRDPSPVGGGFIYPVTAGTGWQGGFQTYQVAMPPPETEEQAAEVLEHVEIWDNEDEGRIRLLSASPPTAYGKTEDGDVKYHYRFRWSECRYGGLKKVPHPPKPRREELVLFIGACAEPGDGETLLVGFTVYGWVHMIKGKWIWVNENPRNIHCKSWGKWRGAVVNCFARPWKAKQGITLRGDFRKPPTFGVLAECITMYTEAFSTKPHFKVKENIVRDAGAGDQFEKCDWPG